MDRDEALGKALGHLLRNEMLREAAASTRLDGETRSVGPVTVGKPVGKWSPEDPGYRESRDHPEAWFSPTEGYIVRSLRSQPDQPGPLVRAHDRHVVHKVPLDAVRLRPEPVPSLVGDEKWRTVARDLARQMQDGQVEPGHRLPSEAKLVVQYSVSRNTVRQALLHLHSLGLVEARHGIGWLWR